MNKTLILLAILFVLSITGCSLSNHNNTFKPVVYKLSGLYENKVYDYYVVIPDGFEALSNPPESPQHGFTILIDKDVGYVYVTADYNSMEYTSTADAVAAHVDSAKSNLNIERIDFTNYSNNKINWSGFKVIHNETSGKKIDMSYILVQKSNEMVYVVGGSTKIDDERRLSSLLEKLLSTFQTVRTP